MIDKEGYLKLCDFGLARLNVKYHSEAKSMCGTPEYLAPEVIETKGHGKPVDWWALGCLIYEMATGMPLFYAENRDKMFQKIRKAEIKFPCTFTNDIKDLLSHLLEKNPENRWGEGVNGVSKIKEHSWFKDFDWDLVLKKEIKAPYVPVLKSDLDLSYFDPVSLYIFINPQEFTEIALDSARSLGSQAFEPFKSKSRIFIFNLEDFAYDENLDHSNSTDEIF